MMSPKPSGIGGSIGQEVIDNYDRVGHLLSLMKSKARRSLRDGQDNGTAEVN
jgi:hypothetical protein